MYECWSPQGGGLRLGVGRKGVQGLQDKGTDLAGVSLGLQWMGTTPEGLCFPQPLPLSAAFSAYVPQLPS